MELNVKLARTINETVNIPRLGTVGKFNLVPLSGGLSHPDDLTVTIGGNKVADGRILKLFPSSEFKLRYGLDSVAAIMIVDTSVYGEIVISYKPVDGIYGDVDLSNLAPIADPSDYIGRYLEEMGSITGLENFGNPFHTLPSRSSDISGMTRTVNLEPDSPPTIVSIGADVDSRISKLESSVYHSSSNIPRINYTTIPYIITNRSAPHIQFTSDSPDVTWYTDDEKNDIHMDINVMSGEIMWVDGTVQPGIYKVTLYIMSNGVRSDTIEIHLNILT